MALNLAALASLAGALIAALLLLRRYLPRGPIGSADNVCLRCGAAAASLTSFACPGCGHDVRGAGVGPPRGRSPLMPFWSVVAFTCVFLVAGTIVASILKNVLPRVQKTSRTVTMRVSSPEIQGVDFFLEARGRRDNDLKGTLFGDLYATGGVIVLEADVPQTRWRLLDLNGKQLDAGERLDGRVVYRWMGLAGVPTDSAVGHSDAARIAGDLGRLAGVQLEMPPVPRTGRALSLSYSSSSSGGSSNLPDERGFPLIVMAGAALWLAGLWLILASFAGLRRREGGAPPAAAAPDGALP